jgi:hypothetical protein
VCSCTRHQARLCIHQHKISAHCRDAGSAALQALVLLQSSSRDVWKTFWATQQRFFKLLCVSLKVKCCLCHHNSSSCCASLHAVQHCCLHGVPTCAPSQRETCTVDMQIPVVVKEAKAALAGGHCVVIGLQATGEAAAQVQLLSRNRPLVLAP